jgi:fructose-bisphosphate aldolase class II
MTKVNIATHLNNVFTASVRQTLADQPTLVDTRKYLGPARTAVAAEVARLLTLLKAF